MQLAEAVFAPKSKDAPEGVGYLMGVATHTLDAGRADLVILDAERPEAGADRHRETADARGPADPRLVGAGVADAAARRPRAPENPPEAGRPSTGFPASTPRPLPDI